MTISHVNFEGTYIPQNQLPAGAIRIKGIWYLNPAAIPEEFKAQRVRLPAFKEELKKNGGNIPDDIKQALESQAEETKKKLSRLTDTDTAQHVDTPISTRQQDEKQIDTLTPQYAEKNKKQHK